MGYSSLIVTISTRSCTKSPELILSHLALAHYLLETNISPSFLLAFSIKSWSIQKKFWSKTFEANLIKIWHIPSNHISSASTDAFCQSQFLSRLKLNISGCYVREIYSESFCFVLLFYGLSIPCSRCTRWLISTRCYVGILWIYSSKCAVHTPESSFFSFFLSYLAGNFCILNFQWEDCKVHRFPTRAGNTQMGVNLRISRRNCLRFSMHATCATWRTVVVSGILAVIFIVNDPKQTAWGMERICCKFRASDTDLQWQALQVHAAPQKYTGESKEWINLFFLYWVHIFLAGCCFSLYCVVFGWTKDLVFIR